MKNMKRNGFTIVELVIVIAVVAILAAVLIPTFGSLIKKANLSADAQAVRQMNTLLATYEVDEKNENVADVIIALSKDNIDAEDYKPLTSNTYFYWVKSLNRIIHVDKNDNVLYPTNLKDATKQGWQSLSGIIETSNEWTVSGTQATIDSGAELAGFMESFNKGNVDAKGVTEILLTDDIDMRGANINLKNVSNDLTIKANAPITISNLRTDSEAFVSEFEGNSYNYGFGGLIGTIGKDKKVSVLVKNINFEGVTVVDTLHPEIAKHSGVIAGNIYNGSTLSIEDVTINNSVITGMDKAGALVGYLSNGEVVATNVTISNTQVLGKWYAATLIGLVSKDTAKVAFTNVKVENVEVKLNDLISNSNTYTHNSDIYVKGGSLYYAGCTNSNYWLGGLKEIDVDGYKILEQSKGNDNIPA